MSTRCWLGVAIVALVTSPAVAGEHCHHCGGCQDVVAVCRPSCDMKEVTETCYEVVCEDFCVPGCSHARKCETPCGECQTVWEPSCGRVRTRQKLVKKEIKTMVPVTKCAVVYLCPRCCQACGCAPAEQPTGAVQPTPAWQNTGGTPVAPAPGMVALQPIAPVAAPPVRPRSIWTALVLESGLRR